MQEMESTITPCVLCGATSHRWTTDRITRAMRRGRVQPRTYTRCERCRLVQIERSRVLTPDAERSRYRLHENDLFDPGYRRYLEHFLENAVVPLVPSDTHILDFGSGPTPALTELLSRRGYPTACYDRYFAPDSSVLERRYGAIVALEVIEHIYDAAETFMRILTALAPSGYLIVHTRVYPASPSEFSHWWYRGDPTHVVFYAIETFQWFARTYNLSLRHQPEIDTFVLQRGDETHAT